MQSANGRLRILVQIAFYLQMYKLKKGYLLQGSPNGIFFWEIILPKSIVKMVSEFLNPLSFPPLIGDLNSELGMVVNNFSSS